MAGASAAGDAMAGADAGAAAAIASAGTLTTRADAGLAPVAAGASLMGLAGLDIGRAEAGAAAAEVSVEPPRVRFSEPTSRLDVDVTAGGEGAGPLPCAAL